MHSYEIAASPRAQPPLLLAIDKLALKKKAVLLLSGTAFSQKSTIKFASLDNPILTLTIKNVAGSVFNHSTKIKNLINNLKFIAGYFLAIKNHIKFQARQTGAVCSGL